MDELIEILAEHFRQIFCQLERIERILRAQDAQGKNIMATLDDITTEISAETTLIGSVQTLITKLESQVSAAGGDQTKIDAIFANAQANAAALTAAIATNTPAAPVTPQTPANSPVTPTVDPSAPAS